MKHRNVARMVVSAGLALSMTASMAIAPITALADEGQGSITITAPSGDNANTSYNAFKIFSGKVVEKDGSKSISDIAWASDAVHTAVVRAIKAEDSGYTDPTDDAASAQAAAEFINSKITGTTSTTILPNASFGNKLADAIDGIAATTSITPGEETSLDDGYYLVVTADVSSKTNQDGTSPIFAIVGGTTAVNVSEKTTVPTVEKKIKDDDATAFGKAASSELGKKLDYQITGTVASNLETYKTYYYAFEDTPSRGIDIDQATITVTVDGTTVAPTSYNVTTEGGILKVAFEDLKAAKTADGATVPVTKDSKVVLTYKASLNANSAIASKSNDNEVKIEYSNNPNTDQHGFTNPDKTKDYTYKLSLVKRDKQNEGRALKGAKFTIQVKNADNASGDNEKYVQADGSLGTEAHEFVTGDDGTVSVERIDAGTYTVHEAGAPEGYDAVPDFTFTISDNAKGMASVDDHLTMDATVTGNSSTIAADANTGTATLTVKDTKQNGLPLTGQSGLLVTVLVGGVIVAISARSLSKHDAEKQ